jgi:hypothetical protein
MPMLFMNSRVVKRVPLDFDWPLNEVWKGYLMGGEFDFPCCTTCGPRDGYGRSCGDGLTPEARAVEQSFYAFGCREEIRWCDKLGQAEVDHLVAEGRLSTWVPGEDGERGHWEQRPRSAAEVNASPHIHDAINRWKLVSFRCKQLGIDESCPDCGGHGDIATNEQREAADNWKGAEPPTGEGYQLWETISEGSPITPVFPRPVDLAQWCAENLTAPGTSDQLHVGDWLSVIDGDVTATDIHSGEMV